MSPAEMIRANHDIGAYRTFIYQKGVYPMTVNRGNEWPPEREPFVGPLESYEMTEEEIGHCLSEARRACRLKEYRKDQTIWMGLELFLKGKWTIVYKQRCTF